MIYEEIEVNDDSDDLFETSMQGFINVKIVRNVMMYKKKREVLDQNYAAVIIQGFFRRLRMNRAIQKSAPTKGQLISKGIFDFFNSPKKRTKNLCSSRLGQKINIFKFVFRENSPKKRTKYLCSTRLGQKFKFSSSLFGRIEDTKNTFQN